MEKVELGGGGNLHVKAYRDMLLSMVAFSHYLEALFFVVVVVFSSLKLFKFLGVHANTMKIVKRRSVLKRERKKERKTQKSPRGGGGHSTFFLVSMYRVGFQK